MPSPPTPCEACQLAERTAWEMFAGLVAFWWLGAPAPRLDLGSLTSAMLGRRPLTWYERHREAFARTGEPAELERMLRHVRADA